MKLDKQIIKNALNNPDQIDLIVYGTIDSTNLRAKELIQTRRDKKMLIVADCQTAGMGRHGKNFYSPASTGVYFSIVTHPNANANDVVYSTSVAAVAVTRAIEKLTNISPTIKWVNDVFIADKKVCGILTQAVTENGKVTSLIIGIGINISTSVFPDEIRKTASSLNSTVDRNLLAAEVTNEVFNILESDDRSFVDEYRRKSNVIGNDITYYKDDVAHNATAVRIDDKCGLVVSENGEEITLTSGEISLRVKNA